MTAKSVLLPILLAMLSVGFVEPIPAGGGAVDKEIDEQVTLYFRRVGQQRFLDPQAGDQAIKDNVSSFLYFWGGYTAERPFLLTNLGLELHLDGTVVSSSVGSSIKVAITRRGNTVYTEEVVSLPPLPVGERPIDIVTDQDIYPGISFNPGDELAFYFQQKQNLNPLDFRYNGTGTRDDSHLILELGDTDYPYVQVDPANIILSVEEGGVADTSFEIINQAFGRLHYDLELPQGQQILSYGDMEDPANTWALSEESNQDFYNVRFTPAQACTLTSAQMLFSADETLGQPDLIVYVWDDSSGFPGAKQDSVVVPFESLNFSPSWQLVYFAGQGIRIRAHQDFHIGYTVAGENPGDALAITSDDGFPVGAEQRSSGKWGLNWWTLYDRQDLDANFFVQAIVKYGDQQAWLDHDPPPGSLPPYGTHQIELRLDAAGLGSGIYKSGLIIENNSPDPFIVLPVTFRVGQTEVAGDDGSEMPEVHSLVGNYPNPFNAETLIRYRVGAGDGESPFVSLAIYNTLGQRVRHLMAGYRPPGVHEALWDGRDDYGHVVAGGLYLCRMEVGSVWDARKMVLLK
jgi:hypothetical protein